jgi:hypothetical protein
MKSQGGLQSSRFPMRLKSVPVSEALLLKGQCGAGHPIATALTRSRSHPPAHRAVLRHDGQWDYVA